jgi:hypothetical protein
MTFTGPGGVGKTRLALESARLACDGYAGGAWLVELVRATGADGVPAIVAEALGASRQPGLSVVDSIVDALKGRHILLLLDNAEHVLDATAALVRRILLACEATTVLVTSREPLGIDGERVWIVPPLDPVLEGAELFEDRVGAVDAEWVRANRETVEVLCRRLDGIPLAIELAAARGRSMTPQDLLARLGDRFGCYGRRHGTESNGTKHFRPRSNGHTSCSASRSSACSTTQRSFLGALTSSPPKRCAATTDSISSTSTTFSARSSTSPWSSPNVQAVVSATSFWRRCATTASTVWGVGAPSVFSAIVTSRTTRSSHVEPRPSTKAPTTAPVEFASNTNGTISELRWSGRSGAGTAPRPPPSWRRLSGTPSWD